MSKRLVKKIFVVDDSEILATALQDYITGKTIHEVQVFSTGEECLLHIGEEPDVVVLDYNLNSVNSEAANGEQILEEIKKLDYSIHVIMLSAQDGYGAALQTITKGAEDYVMKDEDSFEKIVSIIQGLN